jgi:transcription factor-like protein
MQCDQDTPTCSQCRRANRSCPGYRDQLSLMFRDESQAVVRKARAAASGRRGASPVHSSKPQSCSPAIQPFTLAAQEQGTNFFLSTYAWIGASSLIKRGFDYSPSSKLPLSEKALLSCISSLGMAALSGIQKSRPLRLTATREYTSALKLTNAALRDSTEAKTDATLTAIVLLSFFEV